MAIVEQRTSEAIAIELREEGWLGTWRMIGEQAFPAQPAPWTGLWARDFLRASPTEHSDCKIFLGRGHDRVYYQVPIAQYRHSDYRH